MNESVAEAVSERVARRAPPPRLRETFPGEHLVAFRRDIVGFMDRCAAEGPLVGIRVPAITAFIGSDPAVFRRILVEDTERYSKRTRGFAELRNVLGNGLLTSEGNFWLRQRRLMQPSFHKEPLGRFAEPIVRAGERMTERFLAYARVGHPLELVHELMAVTLELVGGTLLGSDVGGDTESVGRAMETVLDVIQQRLSWPVRPSIDAPIPPNVRLRRARDAVRDVALRLVREASSREGGSDLVSVLVRARDPLTGERMTEEQLRDEVLTMLAAGHETTANALTWTLHLLSTNPDVEQRVVAELTSVLGARSPTLEDVPNLRYTQNTLKEGMRLYPPAWTVARVAEEDDELLGYRIPKGAHVFASIYAMQRRADLFERPLAFDPSRFDRPMQRLSYIPFGAGPHLCIGQPFALLEGTLLLACLLPRVRLIALPGRPVVPDPKVTMRPRGGLYVVPARR